MHGIGGLQGENSKLFNDFLNKIRGTDAATFQDVYLIGFPIVENVVPASIFLYKREFVAGETIGELQKITVGKQLKTVSREKRKMK